MIAMSISRAKQTTFDTLTHVLLMLADGFHVQKAALAGVAFFCHNHLYAYQLAFIGEHVNKASMGYLDKVLIVALANVDVLLPLRIMTDHQRSNAFSNQKRNNGLR